MGPDTVKELRWATDLSLWATKEMATAIGPLWQPGGYRETSLLLNLFNLKEKFKLFLLYAPLSPSGLFGNAINTIVERFQETKKQAVAFQHSLNHQAQF